MTDPGLADLIQAHRACVNRVCDAVDSGIATEAGLEDPPGTSFRWGLDVPVADEDDEPRVDVLAGIDPGGTVREAQIVATSGDASVSEEVEYGDGLHRAIQTWLTRFWMTTSAAHEDTGGQWDGVVRVEADHAGKEVADQDAHEPQEPTILATFHSLRARLCRNPYPSGSSIQASSGTAWNASASMARHGTWGARRS